MIYSFSLRACSCFFLLLASLLLAGCGDDTGTPETDVAHDAGAPVFRRLFVLPAPELQAAVDRAAYDWSVTCGYSITTADYGEPIAIGHSSDVAPYAVLSDNPALVAHVIGSMLGLQRADHGVMRADAPTATVTREDCQ